MIELTSAQREIVDADGNFLLLACPGSGKTRSAAERVARVAAVDKVAVCSYTNVGAERIGSVLERELKVVLDRQHFLGTIHAFLIRYVVTPYAHLLGAEAGPIVREGGSWPEVVVHGDVRQRMSLDDFRYAADGALRVCNKPRTVKGTEAEIVASVGTNVRNRKNGLFKKAGVLTADDAMWVALKVLRDHPIVSAAVAARFDEVLLDEAQDTSELQLACLEQIHQTGKLKSLVLVGDLAQSIFSFQGASAKRCRQVAEDRGLREESLTENHRCSQKICDVAVHFSGRAEPDVAVGPDAECPIDPEVLLYSPGDPQAAMTTFRARLADHGLDVTRATVLARSWKMVDALNGRSELFRDTRDRYYQTGQVAAGLKDGTLTATQVRNMQRLLAYCAWGAGHLDEIDEAARDDARAKTYDLIRDLPALDRNLHAWVRETAQAVQTHAASLTDEVAHTGGRTLPAKAEFKAFEAVDVFAPPLPDLRAQTVHSFKGEDNDAVMVVIKRPHHSDPTSQLELWEAATTGGPVDPDKEEEQRVLFVALTRARRYCLVALPDDPRGRKVADAVEGLGFSRVATS